MNIKSIDWLQSAQLLAIIVGVFLVAYELNQSRQISQAQGGGEHWAMIAQQDSAAAGENALEAISKACYGEPLTREEAFTVQLWFAGFRMRYQRLQYVRDTAYQGINSRSTYAFIDVHPVTTRHSTRPPGVEVYL